MKHAVARGPREGGGGELTALNIKNYISCLIQEIGLNRNFNKACFFQGW